VTQCLSLFILVLYIKTITFQKWVLFLSSGGRGYKEGNNADYFMSLQAFNIVEPPLNVPWFNVYINDSKSKFSVLIFPHLILFSVSCFNSLVLKPLNCTWNLQFLETKPHFIKDQPDFIRFMTILRPRKEIPWMDPLHISDKLSQPSPLQSTSLHYAPVTQPFSSHTYW
jgi:hypothetical protein